MRGKQGSKSYRKSKRKLWKKAKVLEQTRRAEEEFMKNVKKKKKRR